MMLCDKYIGGEKCTAQQKVCAKKPSCFGRLLNFGSYAKFRSKSEHFFTKDKIEC